MILLSFLFITLYGQALHSTYNVFLTQGETYSLPMIELFKEQILNFTIENQPNNVELFKTLNILSEQNNNQLFISLSSTFPYFLLINKVDVLNIYNWNSTDINLINQVDLPQQTCLNALLISENSIIIDCYNLTNLNIYIYQEPFWTIIYSRLIQQIPKTTDLQLFTSNSINSILYAQYYQNYEILTQFQFNQSILYNMSIWMQPFNNFIVSNKLQSQNTIYIWNSSTIYLLNVTQSGLNQIYNESILQIITVQIFNPQLVFYECDTLLIIQMYQTYIYMICNQTISSQSLTTFR